MRIVRYLSIITLSSFAVAQAFVLQILDTGTLSPTAISEVHFFAAGNNFGWTILRLTPETLDIPEEIDADGQIVSCGQQLRWLYYNNQRWQRLYPLDIQTAEDLESLDSRYRSLQAIWWRYSQCEWTGVSLESIIGQIVYDYNGMQTELFAWLDYQYDTNSRQYPLRNSLQYFSSTPLWYIYDSAGGIGFVGGLFDEHEAVLLDIQVWESILTIFEEIGDYIYGHSSPIVIADNTTESTTWWQIAIQGIIAATKSINSTQTEVLIEEYNSMVVATNTFTTADIINKKRKLMYQQCQWRTQALNIDENNTVLCVTYPEYSTTQQFVINLNTSLYTDKTIFVKNADIHLYGTMNDTSDPLNIFIDNGNLVWHTEGTPIVNFNNKGNPIASLGVSQWLFLRWNFFIDGLFVPSTGSFNRKTYIHGKVVSLHSPDTATTAKQNHIVSKFWPGFEAYISLQEAFAWRCNTATNIASDGTTCSATVDPYALSPLIFVDRIFSSILLQ